MSFSFSSPQVSPGPDPNQLYDASKVAQAGQAYQSNQLGLQGQQMQLTAADHEQVGRLAAGLLNEPDLGKRAELYSRGVGMLQAQNLAKYAPPTLPDESTLRSLVSQTIPAQTQAEWLQNLTANKAYTNAGNTASTSAPGTTTGTAAPATGGPAPFVGANLPQGVTPDEDQLVRTVYGEARGEPVAGQQAVASVIKTRMGLGKQGVQDVVFAPNQFEAWSDPKNRPGMEALSPTDPQYQAILNNVVRPVMSGQAQDPTGGATNFYNPQLQAQLGRSTPSFAQGNQTTIGNHTFFYGGYAPRGAATASAAPATAPAGAGATPGSYQVASTAPTAPPGSTAAPGAPTLPPAQTDATQPPATTAAAPAPATAQPPQPGVRQPPQPPQPPPAAPLPPPPQMKVLNANGLDPVQQRQVNALAANPQNKQPAVAAAQQAFVNQNIQLRQQAFSDYMQQQQLAVAQGTLSNAQYEAKLKAWQAANPVPTTPRFTQGAGRYNPATTQYEPATPANANLGPAVLGHWGVNNAGQQTFFADDPAAIQAQEAAKTSGAAAGTATGKLTAELADQGRSSAQAIGNIDYGLSQLDKAKAGGINTGYFAPWLSTIGAVAKSLGVPTEAIGVDPKAVGNIQTAQKTLAVVSGAILQQVLGPDSQITDAKLQHFIHAQPGIETDPDAVSRVLNWARSQFVYEREMSAQGMKDASTTGVLPTNWQANYYDKHGFAPIYNPGTGEMQQPDGSAPPRQAPATMATAPINPAARTTGTVYSTPKGPMKWTGTGWLPVQ